MKALLIATLIGLIGTQAAQATHKTNPKSLLKVINNECRDLWCSGTEFSYDFVGAKFRKPNLLTLTVIVTETDNDTYEVIYQQKMKCKISQFHSLDEIVINDSMTNEGHDAITECINNLK